MPHVSFVRFHSCPDHKLYKAWNDKISRKDKTWHGVGFCISLLFELVKHRNIIVCQSVSAKLFHRKWLSHFQVNKRTKVCSNHFPLGRPLPETPVPTLYMKGYDVEPSQPKRKAPRERHAQAPVTRPKRKCPAVGDVPATEAVTDAADEAVTKGVTGELQEYKIRDHEYASSTIRETFTVCNQCSPVVNMLIATIQHMDEEMTQLQRSNTVLIEKLKKYEEKEEDVSPKIDIEGMKDDDKVIYLHTGLANYPTFRWLYDEIKESAKNMTYYRGKTSVIDKKYQKEGTRKPGPKRKLSKENELLLTLMRLKLDVVENYLAFLFNISQTTVSQILSTWIPLLGRELKGLVYWPTQEEILQAYPKCFARYDTVRAIIDCTEIKVQRPSLASANTQIFSHYKNGPTAKFLIACTPAGSISFISDPAGGNMSDKEITRTSGICNLFGAGDICLADRGFTIQDLLLPRGSRLVIPPFTRKGKQFTLAKARKTKQVFMLVTCIMVRVHSQI